MKFIVKIFTLYHNATEMVIDNMHNPCLNKKKTLYENYQLLF